MKNYTLLLLFLFVELILETGVQLESYIVQGISIKNIILYGLCALIFFNKNQNRRFLGYLQLKSINNIYIIFIGYVCFSFLLPAIVDLPRYEYAQSLISFKNELLDGYIIFLVFMLLVDSESQLLSLMRGLAIIIGVAALLTALDALLGSINIFGFDESVTEKLRPRGAFGEPNQTAAILALYMPFMIALSLAKGSYRLLYISFIVIVLLAVITTSSRGGFIALSVGAVYYLWLIRDKVSIGNKTMMIIAAPVLALLAWIILPEAYKDLFLERFSVLGEKNIDFKEASAGRTGLWETALEMFIQSPIFGSGWTAFKNMTATATHNVYLDYAVSLGLIGVSLYITIWYKIFSFIYQTKNFCEKKSEFLIIAGFAAGIIALLVAIFFVNLYKPWLFVWSFVGLGVAYAKCIRIKKFKKMNGLES